MKMIEARERVLSKVDTDHATASTRKRAEVAKRLSLFEDAESVRLAGHGKVDLVVGADLDEDSAVWPALVKLTSRVKKAWPIAGGRRAFRTIAYSSSQFLKGTIDLGSLFDVVQKRDVVVMLQRLQL